MNPVNPEDYSNFSMLELFRVEAETQAGVLTSGLLELERGTGTPQQLEALMRAAHSLKGASRIVSFTVAVQVAHAMEDCFVAAQRGKLTLQQVHIDELLRGVDFLLTISKCDEKSVTEWESEHAADIQKFLKTLAGFGSPAAQLPEKGLASPIPPLVPGSEIQKATLAKLPAVEQTSSAVTQKTENTDRVLRLTAENLNKLLGLAGESLVESRWLRPFTESMQRLRRMQSETERSLDGLRQALESENLSERARARMNELYHQITDTRQFVADRLQELDLFDRRSAHLSNQLYLEVLRARMRPFSDGTRRFSRMIRDLARSLGKQAKLEIVGENTQVDRDILDRLEAPLAHLLRNAVDHGCEMPEERERAGKEPEATIRLEARHSAGMLQVVVSDDGTGLDLERLRRVVVARNLTTGALAERMQESELLEFLFLPGFSMRETVTEISGRGVGLDVVQNMVKSVRGSVRVSTQPGQGMRFQLQLPLTLSVLRTLLVEIGGEPYAIPLARIVSTVKLSNEKIQELEGRQHFTFGDQQVGLLAAHQVLDCGEGKANGSEWPVVVLGDRNNRYGLLVDRFLGERELVVQPLDARLGKVKDISAAALMEDGSPVLIVDVDDMVRSIEKLIAAGSLTSVNRAALESPRKQKRILAVDDSLTVRELERKLLTGRGYEADVAVDGMDGWNAVRTGVYDLVITDVDMPRMDGIELATLIKHDPQLKSLPVMIVSYKDREEDRVRGLEAGADYYLTKGSFHDETLVAAVIDLIGEPES